MTLASDERRCTLISCVRFRQMESQKEVAALRMQAAAGSSRAADTEAALQQKLELALEAQAALKAAMDGVESNQVGLSEQVAALQAQLKAADDEKLALQVCSDEMYLS
jgi:hypothetical protein